MSAEIILLRGGTFVSPRRRQNRTHEDRQIRLAIMEEHVAAMEKAALGLAHGLERTRAMLDELKGAEGMDFSARRPPLDTDAHVYHRCKLAVVPIEHEVPPSPPGWTIPG